MHPSRRKDWPDGNHGGTLQMGPPSLQRHRWRKVTSIDITKKRLFLRACSGTQQSPDVGKKCPHILLLSLYSTTTRHHQAFRHSRPSELRFADNIVSEENIISCQRLTAGGPSNRVSCNVVVSLQHMYRRRLTHLCACSIISTCPDQQG